MYFLYALLLGGLAAAFGSGSSGGTLPDADDDDRSDGEGGEENPVPVLPEDDAPAPEDDADPGPIAGDDGGSGGGDGPRGDPSDGVPDLPDSAYVLGWAGLSAEEQLIVELINRARMDPASEEIRLDEVLAAGISRAAVEALAPVATLSNAAEAHSEDMDDRNFFSHTDPDGGLPWDRAVDEGHSTTFVGENIGWIGSSRAVSDIQGRAEAHHTNLWESDGHQANLMSGSWSEIGLGYDYGSHQGYDGSTFVTELFSDTGNSYLTGVVIEDGDDDGFYDVGEGQGAVRITAFNDDSAYATATWDAGGYSLALPAGTYKVVFEGGDLDAPYETEVTIGDDNVKLDVIDEGGATVISLNAGVPTPEQDVMAALMLDQLDEAPIPVEPEETPELMFF